MDNFLRQNLHKRLRYLNEKALFLSTIKVLLSLISNLKVEWKIKKSQESLKKKHEIVIVLDFFLIGTILTEHNGSI